ncbi:MAG: hypothetical protein L3J43_08425 [Sulfurovum sp.]|nr:hypothetical protein [Sulfurovum sp.]
MLVRSNTVFVMFTAFFFLACGGANTDKSNIKSNTLNKSSSEVQYYPNPKPSSQSKKDITINEENQIVFLGQGSNISTTIDVGANPKSLYVLLSNKDKVYTSLPTISHTKMLKKQKRSVYSDDSKVENDIGRVEHAPAEIQAFNNNIMLLLSKQQLSDKNDENTFPLSNGRLAKKSKTVQGVSKETFYKDVDAKVSTQATLRKIISQVHTDYGTKTLNIWVSDDSFYDDDYASTSGCAKVRCVTQTMVDALATSFLKEGSNNDIYDWVTNIYGEEWGETSKNQIPVSNEITILLTDIKEDNRPNGGVIGFFSAKDSVKKSYVTGSNERIMFYIDSVMFANKLEYEKTWSLDSYWAKETLSTLAHEFVHMIEFYQKTLKYQTNGTQTWLSEMMAVTTSYMVDTKLKYKGYRGVDYRDGSAGKENNRQGKYGIFNKNNMLSLTTWDRTLEDYAKVNAFGAFLVQNYDGAKLLHDMMHNGHTDEQAVESAVNNAQSVSGKTFESLQKEWGTAVLLSDKDNLLEGKPRYNSGDFIHSSYNNTVYSMGSINFFNYTFKPDFSECKSVNPQANCYYKIGDNITGVIELDLILDDITSATLVVK